MPSLMNWQAASLKHSSGWRTKEEGNRQSRVCGPVIPLPLCYFRDKAFHLVINGFIAPEMMEGLKPTKLNFSRETFEVAVLTRALCEIEEATKLMQAAEANVRIRELHIATNNAVVAKARYETEGWDKY